MKKLTHSYDFFTSEVDGIDIFFRKWLPEKEVQRVFVIQHGIGEHGGRYGNIIKALHNEHTAFYALDARGHGQSPGIRGHADEFNDYSEDLDVLVDITHQQFPKVKRYLFGHSMGGLIALDYCLDMESQEKLDAVIISSPGIKPVMDPIKHVKKFIGTKLASFFPKTILETGLDLSNLSQDPYVIERYKEDRLTHGKISFQMGKSLFEVGDKILEGASKIELPFYIFHGTGDQLVSSAGSTEVYEKISSQKKSIHLFEGLFHETFNEKEGDRQQVCEALVNWMSTH
ncbi:MAG: lysophospholipase [Halobacteriovoraceae bacterium]|nr:lysophospholipase [Halobacteriovoraceae bacterium]